MSNQASSDIWERQLTWKTVKWTNQGKNIEEVGYVGGKKLGEKKKKNIKNLREIRKDITLMKKKKEQLLLDFKNMIGEMKASIELQESIY